MMRCEAEWRTEMFIIDWINAVADYILTAWNGVLFYIVAAALLVWFFFRYIPMIKKEFGRKTKQENMKNLSKSMDDLFESPEFKNYLASKKQNEQNEQNEQK